MLTGLRKYDQDFVALLALLFVGIKYTLTFNAVTDIGLYDETGYLASGAMLPQIGLPRASSSPLYAIYYYALSLISPDRVALYYLNYRVLTIGTSVAFYAVLRRSNLGPLPSLVFSALLLVSNSNLPVWPKVGHFALLVILIVLVITTCVASRTTRMLLATVGCLLVSFARPEYFLSFGLFFAILVAMVTSRRTPKRSIREDAMALTLPLLLAALMWSLVGLPVGQQGRLRGFQAFGQHFSLNWVEWSQSDLDPWTNWEEIVATNFGPTQTIAGAISSNPALFGKHVGSNLCALTGVVRDNVRVYTELSSARSTRGVVTRSLLWALMLVALIKPRKVTLKDILREFWSRRYTFFCLSLFCVPSLLFSVLFYPRVHYLLPVTVMMLLVGAALMAPFNRTPSSTWLVAACGLAAVLATPSIGDAAADSPVLETKAVISFVRELNIESEVTLLEIDGGYNVYLGDNYRWVEGYRKTGTFDEFLATERPLDSSPPINMVIASQRLMDYPQYKQDPTWQRFVEQPDSYGFRKMNITNTSVVLFVRENLLRD